MEEDKDREELIDESEGFPVEEGQDIPTRAQVAKMKKDLKKAEKKAKYRLSNTTMILMVALAIVVDLIEFFTTWIAIGVFTSPILSFLIGLTYWFWFNLKGVNFIGSTKKLITSTVTFIGELIPAFDAIPLASFFWTIGIVIMLIIVRLEDKAGLSVLGTKGVAKIGKALKPSLKTAKEKTLSVGRSFVAGKGGSITKQTLSSSRTNMLRVASGLGNTSITGTPGVNKLNLNREKMNKLASLSGRGVRSPMATAIPQIGSDNASGLVSTMKQMPKSMVDSEALTRPNVNDYFEANKLLGDSTDVAADKAWKKVSNELGDK